MQGEVLLLPKLEALMAEYEAAWRMAEACDHHRDMKEIERRQGYLSAYLALIRPQKQDTTQPLF